MPGRTKAVIAVALISAALSAFPAFAQPAIVWEKTVGGNFDDGAHSMQMTSDGGFVTAGFTRSQDGDIGANHGGKEFLVTKFLASGTVQWRKCYGGREDEIAYSIALTKDGGYIVAGTTESWDGDVSGYKGSNDAWVVKLSSSGAIQWQKTFGGNGEDGALCIQQTLDNGFVFAGYTNSLNGDVATITGNCDAWIVKLDSLGNLAWEKTYGTVGDDIAYSIHQCGDGGFIVTGKIDIDYNLNSGSFGLGNVLILRLDGDGKKLWLTDYGATHEDIGYCARQTADSGYVIAGCNGHIGGQVSQYHGLRDAWIIKLDSSGGLEWDRVMGGAGDDIAYSVRPTLDGGYIVLGETDSYNGDVVGNHGNIDYWVVKLDAYGNISWQTCLGGRNLDVGHDIRETTATNTFILVGEASPFGYGDISKGYAGTDLWAIKLQE